MSGPTGVVFDVSRACVDDGPGLRTVVFLKGCRLNCPWCQNPEGQSFAPEVAYDRKRCIGCRTCRQVCQRDCPFDHPPGEREPCAVGHLCSSVCPARAKRLVGATYDVGQLVEEVAGPASDASFFQGTGGGVTFSGGEPLAQPEFLFASCDAFAERGIHRAVETAGHWPVSLAPELARRVDLVLFTLTHVDEEKFRQATGATNRLLLQNLTTLLGAPVAVSVRLLVIPGLNDTPADARAIAGWLKEHPAPPKLTLVPFHRLATAKAELYGRPFAYADRPPVGAATLAQVASWFADAGIAAAPEG